MSLQNIAKGQAVSSALGCRAKRSRLWVAMLFVVASFLQRVLTGLERMLSDCNGKVNVQRGAVGWSVYAVLASLAPSLCMWSCLTTHHWWDNTGNAWSQPRYAQQALDETPTHVQRSGYQMCDGSKVYAHLVMHTMLHCVSCSCFAWQASWCLRSQGQQSWCITLFPQLKLGSTLMQVRDSRSPAISQLLACLPR